MRDYSRSILRPPFSAFVLLLPLALLQGCMTVGVYQVKALSFTGGVIPPRAEPLPVVAGVRIASNTNTNTNAAAKGDANDHTDEPAPALSPAERFVLGSFTAELSAANLFRQVTYPTLGGEDIIFEVTTWGRRQGPLESFSAVPYAFVCTVTVLVLCPPVSAIYEYDILVHAEREPDHIGLGSYLARGKSRTRYGIFSSDEADTVGWQAAVTSAFDELMNAIRRDENGWLVGVIR
jgi:hypothetical protein